MGKTLKHLRTALFVIVTIEILALIGLSLFWFENWYNFQSYINGGFLILISSVLLIFDAFFAWFSLIKISKIRSKNDLEAAALVGNDIQEAYDFGQIGLIVIDETSTIMWANSLFTDRQMDLIDSNIFTWLPSLKDLVNAPVNKIVHVEIKGRAYDVKYLSEPRLFIFKDSTEYDNIVSYSKEQALVLGVVMIDNYNDVASETDESGDVVNKIRNIIADYFHSFGVLLRRVRNDTYFGVCNYASLSKMEDDGFSILEKVRAAGKGEENPLTLSIGFAHDFPDVSKLNEMASSAVDVCLSRGGDQAVVSKYGAELRFFGGKTAAFETTSKVKVRSVSDSLVSLIKSSSNVFIMGHTDMDMDSLGASLGIMAMAEWCKKPARIIYSARLAEKKTRIAFQEAFPKDQFDKMTISPEDVISQIKNSTLLVVVDISRPSMTMSPRALEKASKVIVIDHHRRAEEFIERPVLSYIEPSASSASELVAMMIRYATANPRIELSSTYAILMLAGIFLDSNYFKNKATGMRTFEAAEILKDYGADNSLADDYLKDEFEEYSLTTKIISSMQTPHYGIVYCTSDEDYVVERATLSKVANQLMQLKGINACFVIGRTDSKTVRLSARSDGSVNVQLLCEKMGGGGHFTGAASAFTDTTIEKVVATLTETLDEYLDAAKSSVNKEGEIKQ
jgi:c-di-AMP phosphodiesterase-like protein